MEFEFKCPLCNKTISAQSEWANGTAECPSCGAVIEIPMPPAEDGNIPPSSPSSPEMKALNMGSSEQNGIADSSSAEDRQKTPILTTQVKSKVDSVKIWSLLLRCLEILLLVFIAWQLHTSIRISSLISGISSQIYTAVRPREITEYRIVFYTWEEEYDMNRKFREALDDGFEPAGYLCQNSVKGGFFLFVKRR